jgi:molybdopterin-guanine dinucleotide biosynthesis protein A
VEATGILLVGGDSSRFGSPKALARVGGETLAERAWRLLDAFPHRLAVGKASDGLELPFELVDDGTDVRAPIAGVVAGLRAASHEIAVVLPVDCPALSAATVRRLGTEVAVPQTGPLPGAYTKSMLAELEARLQRGELSLRGVNRHVIEVDAAELADVDVPGDLADQLLD